VVDLLAELMILVCLVVLIQVELILVDFHLENRVPEPQFSEFPFLLVSLPTSLWVPFI
jgi:hypothetical protein